MEDLMKELGEDPSAITRHLYDGGQRIAWTAEYPDSEEARNALHRWAEHVEHAQQLRRNTDQELVLWHVRGQRTSRGGDKWAVEVQWVTVKWLRLLRAERNRKRSGLV